MTRILKITRISAHSTIQAANRKILKIFEKRYTTGSEIVFAMPRVLLCISFIKWHPILNIVYDNNLLCLVSF